MIKLHASYCDGVLRIQKAPYIEDGWYIENFADGWTLFEIPLYGGQPQEIGKYPSFEAAYKNALLLT